jgi:uncharacterized membrane protein YbhN (UPF0104 family)
MAKLDISFREGMISYLAGMSAAAMPGGSWVPVRLAQEHGTVKMRQAAPALFISFVADTTAISLLAWFAMVLNQKPGNYFVLPGIGLAIATTLVLMGRSERVWHWMDRQLAKNRFTRKLLPKEEDIHASVRALMRFKVVLGGVGLSMTTTLLAAATLYVVINGLTIRGVSVQEALYVHTYAESAAIALPIPGGYGVSDSSIAGMLASLSIGFVRGTYVVLAIRSSDVLFKTVVGSVFLLVFYHRLLASVLKIRRRARRAWRVGRRWTISGVRLTGLPAMVRVMRRYGHNGDISDVPGTGAGAETATVEPAVSGSAPTGTSIRRDTASLDRRSTP